jgi:hypothetical protein
LKNSCSGSKRNNACRILPVARDHPPERWPSGASSSPGPKIVGSVVPYSACSRHEIESLQMRSVSARHYR